MGQAHASTSTHQHTNIARPIETRSDAVEILPPIEDEQVTRLPYVRAYGKLGLFPFRCPLRLVCIPACLLVVTL